MIQHQILLMRVLLAASCTQFNRSQAICINPLYLHWWERRFFSPRCVIHNTAISRILPNMRGGHRCRKRLNPCLSLLVGVGEVLLITCINTSHELVDELSVYARALVLTVNVFLQENFFVLLKFTWGDTLRHFALEKAWVHIIQVWQTRRRLILSPHSVLWKNYVSHAFATHRVRIYMGLGRMLIHLNIF